MNVKGPPDMNVRGYDPTIEDHNLSVPLSAQPLGLYADNWATAVSLYFVPALYGTSRGVVLPISFALTN